MGNLNLAAMIRAQQAKAGQEIPQADGAEVNQERNDEGRRQVHAPAGGTHEGIDSGNSDSASQAGTDGANHAPGGVGPQDGSGAGGEPVLESTRTGRDDSADAGRESPADDNGDRGVGHGDRKRLCADESEAGHSAGSAAQSGALAGGDLRDSGGGGGDRGPDRARISAPVNPLAGLRLNIPRQAQPKAPGSLPPTKVVAPVASPTVESAPPDSLAALSLEESGGVPPIDTERFPDEIPATAPDRELPAEMTEGMKTFVASLDMIYTLADDPELFGQYIRTIMLELRENQQYEKLLTDDDVAVMIRGMRESMGLAKIRKEESKAKRGGTAKSRKAAGKQDDMIDDLAALAAESGISFD